MMEHFSLFFHIYRSTQFHVFEITRQLPRFSMYDLNVEPSAPEPTGKVTFSINDRPQRVKGHTLTLIMGIVPSCVTQLWENLILSFFRNFPVYSLKLCVRLKHHFCLVLQTSDDI